VPSQPPLPARPTASEANAGSPSGSAPDSSRAVPAPPKASLDTKYSTGLHFKPYSPLVRVSSIEEVDRRVSDVQSHGAIGGGAKDRLPAPCSRRSPLLLPLFACLHCKLIAVDPSHVVPVVGSFGRDLVTPAM